MQEFKECSILDVAETSMADAIFFKGNQSRAAQKVRLPPDETCHPMSMFGTSKATSWLSFQTTTNLFINLIFTYSSAWPKLGCSCFTNHGRSVNPRKQCTPHPGQRLYIENVNCMSDGGAEWRSIVLSPESHQPVRDNPRSDCEKPCIKEFIEMQ